MPITLAYFDDEIKPVYRARKEEFEILDSGRMQALASRMPMPKRTVQTRLTVLQGQR